VRVVDREACFSMCPRESIVAPMMYGADIYRSPRDAADLLDDVPSNERSSN